MQVDTDSFDVLSQPKMLDKAEEIKNYLQSLTTDELEKLWHTSDKLFQLNVKRLKQMNLNADNQTPAIIAFCGLQYQYMAPDLFTEQPLSYIQQNVRILSSFYGVLRPFDGVVPYRLEMKAKAHVNRTRNLHEFWNRTWFDDLTADDDLIINLASKMYGDQVGRYIKKSDKRMISCVFGYYDQQKKKVIQDNTYAKMARGEMVRYLAENEINDYHEITEFHDLGYHFTEQFSDENRYVFLRNPEEKRKLK